jgi:hypothetical protein
MRVTTSTALQNGFIRGNQPCAAGDAVGLVGTSATEVGSGVGATPGALFGRMSNDAAARRMNAQERILT